MKYPVKTLSLVILFYSLLLNNYDANKSDKKKIKAIKQSSKIKLHEIFENPSDDYYLFANHRKRYKIFGSKKMQKYYNSKKAGKTVKIQFSSRKRLYDHNLLLRAIFQGKIIHKIYGNFSKLFVKPIFFDLGSAILYKKGALTVRDIYEDKQVYPHLSFLIASDINDYKSKKTQFINIYKKKYNNLPFPVEEISMSITKKKQVDKMLKKYIAGSNRAVIFRTVNTGIDYYYKRKQLRKHFRAILSSLQNRNVLYFFNRFVLFKAKKAKAFHIVGEIFEKMFAAEKGKHWLKTYWKNRTLKDGFIPAKAFIEIH